MEQLHSGLDQVVKEVNDFGPQVKELEQRMQTLINLEDSFQGKGAQAIKSFYEEAHMPFLLLMEGVLTDFAETIGQIKSSVQAFESNEKGVIHEQFLQENVEQGLTTAENVTLSLTDEANALIDEVNDIVALPEIQEEEFRQRIKQSRNQVDHTLENLYALDEESTGKLEKMDNDLQMMKTYVEKISGLFQNGDLRVADYEVKQLSTYDFHQELVGAVKEKAKHNTFSLDVFLEWGGKKVLSRFGSLGDVAIAYIQEKFSMRTMDYSVRAMKAVLTATGSHITAAEFTTVKDQVVKEVAVSDYKSEWHGTYLTLANGRILRKYTDTAVEVQYQFVEEIPESREKGFWAKAGDVLNDVGEGTWNVGKEAADFLVLDDINTLRDSEASIGSKAIAAASFIPVGKVLKLKKAGELLNLKNTDKIVAKKEINKVDEVIDKDKVKHLDNVPRMKKIEVSFKRNTKHDSEEFARQLKDQEKGMNDLTVDEYLKNRERYIAEGRAIEGNTAQKIARQEVLKDKVAELRKQGLSRADAKKQASKWMETKAALHNPDQIAGGRADNIGGLGDKRVNSSIGSQWKYRIDVVDQQIREVAKIMSPDQLKNTYLNVKLTQ
ncbi:T7SS effector LXG polymorphic toxin [Virgibacillus halodenitrificans]|uniref:T7SS effector LXG polymorphic toxin n=1 Tax=Virgibacillus halodenitrificans TaxID=1482 RepID=UPI000EF4BAF6|nr:T7SS effector LXG polymorphic toxin [Virgibacillus halodenitrificans]